MDTNAFPIRKSAVLGKLKKIKGLRLRLTHSTSHKKSRRLTLKIAQKGHFRMETNEL